MKGAHSRVARKKNAFLVPSSTSIKVADFGHLPSYFAVVVKYLYINLMYTYKCPLVYLIVKKHCENRAKSVQISLVD
jgi:hypothetical protein